MPSSTTICFSDKFYGIQFSAPVVGGMLLIPVQDPKHAKITSRNQVFSGARLSTFASTTVRYNQVLAAQKVGSILSARDVINVDKQDDMAALHTFSSLFLNEVVAMFSGDASYEVLRPIFLFLGIFVIATSTVPLFIRREFTWQYAGVVLLTWLENLCE